MKIEDMRKMTTEEIKKTILINIINHYIHQYYDELDYRVFKNLEQNK